MTYSDQMTTTRINSDVHTTLPEGTYRVLKRIGTGGFSRVYEAQDSRGKLVALKKSHITKHVLNPMLRHESCALTLLEGHPSIPSVYAWGRSQYFEYLAMERLGSPLTDILKKHTRFNVRSVLLLMNQMLDTLQHLHTCHIVHRDIKPENFLFGVGENGGRARLIDYGLCCYYRDPVSLGHYPLEQKQKFVGTVQFSSLNAHNRLSLSRRDDLESLAYTMVTLLKGRLPWAVCESGTIEHRENRIREKKRTWTGARLCVGLPKEFGDFIDYVRGLEYEQEPDYGRWKSAFDGLFEKLRILGSVGFEIASAGDMDFRNGSSDEEQSTSEADEHSSLDITAKASPVTAGQYVLIQILPHLTIEGVSQVSLDQSRWHDPQLTMKQWRFPRRPALVLDVQPVARRHGAYLVTLLPLRCKPGELNVEESKTYIGLGRSFRAEHERVVIPTEEWTIETVYHDPPPKAIRVQVESGHVPIYSHWRLDDIQLEYMKSLLTAPLPSQTSPEARAVLYDFEAIGKRFSFTVYAQLSSFTSALASSSTSSEASVSWIGTRGFVNELVRISRRLSADNEWPWSDEEEDENGRIDSSDDGFMPTTSWPAPQGVTAKELLGDEEEFVKERITIMTMPPGTFEKDLYNDDEKIY